MRKSSIGVLVAPLFTSLAGPAFAHAYPRSAIPPVDSTTTQTPFEVMIGFTGAMDPRFSTIEATGSDAQRVDDAKPRLVHGDAMHFAVGVGGLKPGSCSVSWHATSLDTHQTDGSYRFTVAATNAADISLAHVWARATAGLATAGLATTGLATAGLATTGAACFTVTSKGQPDRLIGVATPIAATAELHETINDSGIMKMHSVQSVSVVPGKPVTFQPGGYHVMLTGLTSPLEAGDSFPLTLSFEHVQRITVIMASESVTAGAWRACQACKAIRETLFHCDPSMVGFDDTFR